MCGIPLGALTEQRAEVAGRHVMAMRCCALLCLAIGTALGASARGDDRRLIERLGGFRVCAHRGGYFYADSNTVARFGTALRQGVDIVETDLQVSSDGVPFLFHATDVTPATDCRGPISKHSASSIEHCHLRNLDQGPDRFETALQWSRGRVVIDAELKSPMVVQPAIDLVRRYSAYEWVYFQVGAGVRLYEQARAYDGYVALEAAPQGQDAQLALDHLLAIRDPRLVSLQLHPDLATRPNLEAIRRSGKVASADAFRFGIERRVRIWPFERVAFCTDLYQLGINIAVTNVPESCVEQRTAAQSSSPARSRSANQGDPAKPIDPQRPDP